MTTTILLLIVLFNEGLIVIQLMSAWRRVRKACIGEHMVTLGAAILALTIQPAAGAVYVLAASVAFVGFVRAVILTQALSALFSRQLEGFRYRSARRTLVWLSRLPTPFETAPQTRLLEELDTLRHGNADVILDRVRGQLSQAIQTGNAGMVRQVAVLLIVDLVMARRWEEAAGVHRRILGGRHEMLDAGAIAALARTYAVLGDLDAMTDAVWQLESRRETATDAGALNVARVVFLAYHGASDEISFLLGQSSGLVTHAPQYVRPFYRGIAAVRAGRRKEGLAEFERAIELSGESDREIVVESVDTFLAHYGELPSALHGERSQELIDALVDRLRPYAAVPATTLAITQIPITWALTALNLAIWVLLEITGDTMRSSDLIDAGALYSPAIRAGEWWRLLAPIALHAGFIHVAVNSIGLLYLGRLTERLYGATAFLVLYAASGVAGTLASMTFGVGVSVGASGAIYGILGALIALLYKGRARFPEGWRRQYLNWMVMLAAINLFFGAQISQIDNAAHMGGLAGGFVVGLALTRRRFGDARPRVAQALISAVAVIIVIAGALTVVMVVNTDREETLARLPTREFKVGRVTLVETPGSWIVEESPRGLTIFDPFSEAVLEVAQTYAHDIETVSPARRQAWGATAAARFFAEAGMPNARPLALDVGERVLALWGVTVRATAMLHEIDIAMIESERGDIACVLEIARGVEEDPEDEAARERRQDRDQFLVAVLDSARAE